jgi:magnesium transporter
MDAPSGLFRGETTITQAVQTLRELVKRQFTTYLYIIDQQQRLEGVVVMRDLLLARNEQTLSEIMLPHPFALAILSVAMVNKRTELFT